MSRLILDQQKYVANWAAQRMPTVANGLKDGVAIGIAEGNLLYAAAVFTDYRVLPFGKDIQLHFTATSPRWATRGNIRAILSYPFVQLQCTRLTAIISRKNKRARKVLEGLGFRLEGVARRAFDGKYDAFIMGMLKEEADRWFEERPRLISVKDFGDLASAEPAAVMN